MTEIKLACCPFCGFEPKESDADCIYPVDHSRKVWSLNCYETGGGCGVSVLGSSVGDVIKRWNTRKITQYPIEHSSPKVPGVVTQYAEKVFIWNTIADHRDPEMRVANSLKKAWAHLASHLRIKGVL